MTYAGMVAKYKKIIAENEEIISQLRIANSTLLDNNVKLKKESDILRAEITRQSNINSELISKNRELATQKDTCKQKCELTIKQKDQIITEKQHRLDTLPKLADVQWTISHENNQIHLHGKLP